VLVVGDGELRDECEAFASVNDLPVTFAGFKNQSEVGQCYAAADVLVLPSESGETWGLVANEAANFKLALLLSDRVGSTVDLCRDEENGFQYPCGDSKALASRMQWFLQNSDTLEAMGERSAEIIKA